MNDTVAILNSKLSEKYGWYKVMYFNSNTYTTAIQKLNDMRQFDDPLVTIARFPAYDGDFLLYQIYSNLRALCHKQFKDTIICAHYSTLHDKVRSIITTGNRNHEAIQAAFL